MAQYSYDELVSIYELGRMYYEMGYLTAAERIFNGLLVVDHGRTPACIGSGLVKLERGQHSEAMQAFRVGLKSGVFALQAKVCLALVFLGAGDFQRAATLLRELQPEFESKRIVDPDLRRLWEGLSIRARDMLDGGEAS